MGVYSHFNDVYSELKESTGDLNQGKTASIALDNKCTSYANETDPKKARAHF